MLQTIPWIIERYHFLTLSGLFSVRVAVKMRDGTTSHAYRATGFTLHDATVRALRQHVPTGSELPAPANYGK
jgi:hypothetical protein